ncbi:hypothetical protein [Rhodococcus marinonascens]|uniref:hypothetical protein n=1 Tax=Rhodococcus marinonascens TaxID=38311 RepID=UPI000B29B466|nr:hypothetical protein [Rhodococcus marinonascens]
MHGKVYPPVHAAWSGRKASIRSPPSIGEPSLYGRRHAVLAVDTDHEFSDEDGVEGNVWISGQVR